MKAIDIEKEKLVLKDIKDPVTNPGEILIKTTATAINRADLVQRSGLYHPPPGASPILGLECAGEVIGLGEGVEGFEEGQKVCALLTGGGYAEKVAVSEGQVLPIPSNFDTILSAAIPEVFGTAFLNLYMEANLVPNERVLLHAGASGVGTAAIQLCKAFGNPCFVTAGTLEKIKFYNIALGNQTGTVKMYIDNYNQGSSSILQPKLHLTQRPDIKFESEENVNIDKLDNIIDSLDYNFINMDVQGFELEVLKGGKNYLKKYQNY